MILAEAAAQGVIGDATWLDLLLAAAALVLAVVLAKAVTMYMNRVLKDRLDKSQLKVLVKAVYYGLILLLVFIVLSTLGVNISSLLVAGGVVGVIVGFASQRIVGNFISGIFLFVERPMKIGDIVNVDGQTGIVEDIRIFSTRLRGFDGVDVRLPNEKVFTNKIKNYVAYAARRIDLQWVLRYGGDTDRARELIKGLLDAHPYILVKPGADIAVTALGPDGAEISVYAWGPISGWYGAKMDIIQQVKDAFAAEGLEIAAARRVVESAPAGGKRGK